MGSRLAQRSGASRSPSRPPPTRRPYRAGRSSTDGGSRARIVRRRATRAETRPVPSRDASRDITRPRPATGRGRRVRTRRSRSGVLVFAVPIGVALLVTVIASRDPAATACRSRHASPVVGRDGDSSPSIVATTTDRVVRRLLPLVALLKLSLVFPDRARRGCRSPCAPATTRQLRERTEELRARPGLDDGGPRRHRAALARRRAQRARPSHPWTQRACPGARRSARRRARSLRRRSRQGPLGCAAPRHRQAVGAGGDPQQAGQADGARVDRHRDAPRRGRADDRRTARRLARRLVARRRRAPRAVGRARVSARPARRGDLPRRPARRGRRRVRGDDVAALVQAAAVAAGTRARS